MSNIDEAVALLLDDNLVWSEEFERIRKPLATLLSCTYENLSYRVAQRQIADALTEAEITAADPLEQWVWDAARQLGILDNVAQRSQTMASALKKLFSRL